MAGDGWVDIEVTGLKELEQTLKRLPDDLARLALAQAVLAGAIVVREEARRLCPRKSGKLALSIRARKKKSASNVAVMYQVGPTKFYGHMVEFGTSPHIIRAVKEKKLIMSGGQNRWRNVYAETVNHTGSPAKPFLRPAFDNSTDRVIEAMRKRLAEAIERGEIKFWKRHITSRG